jgi:hypothetical protein
VLRIDTAGLEFVDSSGLRCLVAADRRCQETGVLMELVAGPTVKRLLDLVGLADYFNVQPDVVAHAVVMSLHTPPNAEPGPLALTSRARCGLGLSDDGVHAPPVGCALKQHSHSFRNDVERVIWIWHIRFEVDLARAAKRRYVECAYGWDAGRRAWRRCFGVGDRLNAQGVAQF